jgi:hypothetical protein
MAGQSNMQGFCSVITFPQIAADPTTAPTLKKIVNPDGTPRVHENIWISTSGCAKDATPGQLTTGYGGGRGDRIGPELTFGIYTQEHVKEPILLVKTAWGGKTLCRDFRPPSAGVHPTHLKALEELRKENKDTAELEKEYAERHGKSYRMMIGHAQSVLGDIKMTKVEPGSPADGKLMAGFMIRLLMDVLPKYGANARYALPRIKGVEAGKFQKQWDQMVKLIETAPPATKNMITFDEAKRQGLEK